MMRYATLLLCLLAGPALSDLYKWTDENGKTHYSDQPPSGATKSETIKGPKNAQGTPTPPPIPAGALPAKGAPDPEMEFRKRRVQAAELEAKQQKDTQAAEEKKRNCERATEQLKAYERGGRVTRYGPNGEQIFLNEQEIQSELVNARKTADSWCK